MPLDELRQHVRRSVAERVPVDERERRSIAAFLAAYDELSDPFSEDADITHVTGSAIVVGARGVVLHRHKRLGIWLQPGGHVEAGESPREGALREAIEETGLRLRFDDAWPSLVHVDVHPGPRGHTHFDLRYIVTGDDSDPTPPEGESPECYWFSWPDALAMAEPGLIGALEAVFEQITGQKAPPRRITTVIFDYGGVFSVSPFGKLAEAETALGLAPDTIVNLLGYGISIPEPTSGEPYVNKWHLLETGEIDFAEYSAWVDARAVEVFGKQVSLGEVFGSGFGSMTIYWPMVHEAQRLKAAGYRIAICSNNIAVYRDAWQSQIPIDIFEVVIDSSEVGVRKPDPAIYQLTCERLGISPAQAVFLDDHPANVRGAIDAGLSGVLVGDDVIAAIDELRAMLK
jgi:epoxide hydrolase-like predicted phosphatase